MKEYINIKDMLKVDRADKKYLVLATYGDYSLIYRFTSFQPWIVAYLYDEANKGWANGHYFEDMAKAVGYMFYIEKTLNSEAISAVINICDKNDRGDIADLLCEMNLEEE